MLMVFVRPLKLLLGAIAALLVLLAVVLVMLRVGVHYLPDYRAEVEARLGEAMGEEVQIDELQATWRWRELRVELGGVRLGDAEGGLFFDRLAVNLDVVASVRHWSPRLRDLVLVDPRLTVQRNADGTWQLVGVGVEPRAAALEELDILMSYPGRLRVEGARMDVLDQVHRARYRFSDVDATVDEANGQRRLVGSGQLPPAWGGGVDFIVHWPSEAAQPLTHGPMDVYVRGDGVGREVMEHLLGGPDAPPYVSLGGSLELWARFGDGLPQPDGVDRRGELVMRAADGAAALPYLFREPIAFREFEAEADWRWSSQGWTVNVGRARVDNEDGIAHSRVRVDKQPDGSPFLDIRASVEGRADNAGNTSRYLPVGIMLPGLVEWLDESIHGGTATRADVVFHGRAQDFPFDDGSGRFEVQADVEDVMLAYQPEWPPITGLDGVLHFHGRSMQIDATRGTISGARIRDARARIEDLARSPLRVDGRVRGPGDAYLDFLREMPPARDMLEAPLGGLRLDGEHDLDLSMVIPFDDTPMSLNGDVRLRDGRVRLGASNLAVEALNGEVSFDQRGIRGEGVSARFLDSPVVLDITTDQGDSGDERIRLAATADRLDAGRLDTVLTGGAALLQGAAEARLTADFPRFDAVAQAGEPAVNLAASSALVGVGVALPAPLGKEAADERPLELDARISADGLEPVRIRYGPGANAIVDAGPDGALRRAGLRFGGESATLPGPGSIRLDGMVETLDVPAWWRWYGEHRAGEGVHGETRLSTLNLTIGTLMLGGLTLEGQRVEGERDLIGWDLALAGESAQGTLFWPDSPNLAVEADFEHLRLPLPEGFTDETEPTDIPDDLLADVNPGSLSRLRAQVDALELDGRPLGRLQLLGAPEADSYVLSSLLLRGDHHSVTGRAAWFRDPEDRTELELNVHSNDTGGLLSGLGYEGVIRGGGGHGNIDLQSRSAPLPLGLDTLDGTVSLVLRSGFLTQVEPGAGRVFGLLSVANLPRRLMLNFGDVFAEGFAFDRIDADFSIKDGVATPRVLVMDGPAARIEASGPVDLGQRTYNQTVTVTPKASSTLPILGGVFGGPPGAVVMFLAQQVFSDGFDRIARLRYRVTGPWADPVITPVRRARTPAAEAGPPGVRAPE